MFPANSNIELPEAFELYAVKPAKHLELDPELVEEKQALKNTRLIRDKIFTILKFLMF